MRDCATEMPAALFDPRLRYNLWQARTLPSAEDLCHQRAAAHRLGYQPLISIVMPVFNTPPAMLRRMLHCIISQTYSNWQLCLADDGSSEPWIARTLSRLAATDRRVRFVRRPRNGGISDATNSALALATGEFIAFCDHDDEIDPRTFYSVASCLNQRPDTDLLYFDLDHVAPSGIRTWPLFFPDWSPELLLASPYLVHAVVRRSVLALVGELRSETNGGQDYDLALRLAEVTSSIVHIPATLYHWRIWSGSAAFNPGSKPYAYAARKLAVTDALRRRGIAARCVDHSEHAGIHRVRFDVIDPPLISMVVVLSADGAYQAGADTVAAQIHQLAQNTAYRRFEIVCVGPTAITTRVAALLEAGSHPGVRCMPHGGTDLSEQVNLGAAEARGEILLLLESGLEVSDPEWLVSLLEYAQQPGIGAVGAQIRAPDKSLWHAGIVIPNGAPIFVQQDIVAPRIWPPEAYYVANYSAVSAVCLMTRRSIFETLGGFRHADVVGFSDVDYCLRLRQHGYRVVFTPFSRMLRTHWSPAGFAEGGIVAFRQRWANYRDPYYNVNLSPDGSFQPDLDSGPDLRVRERPW
jgi:O-antigen biosynthesis protein